MSVEPFHLFRYLDEQAFRFNNRQATDAERFSMAVSGAVGRRVTYKKWNADMNQRVSKAEQREAPIVIHLSVAVDKVTLSE